MASSSRRPATGLHLKLVVAGAATTVVCVALVVSITTYWQSRLLAAEIGHTSTALRKSMVDRGSLLAESMAASMETAIAGYNLTFVGESLGSLASSNDELDHAYVANAAGSILVHTEPTMVGQPAPYIPSRGRPVFRKGIRGASHVEISHSIHVAGELWGDLVLAFDLTRIESRQSAAFDRGSTLATRGVLVALAAGFATALLGVIGSLYLNRRLLRPIGDLARETEAIAQGNLDQPILQITSRDELGHLARQFERMRSAIKSHVDELVVAKQDAEDATKKEQKLRTELEDHSKNLERKVHERTAELQDTNERLTEYDRLKTEFLNNVSHELRSPLAAIAAAAKIIHRYGDADGRAEKKFSGVITAETERLARLIDDLLDLAKIEAGRIDWELEPITNPAKLIDHVAQTFRPLAIENDIKLTAKTDRPLPAINGDSDRIIQVVTNLMDNAVKYTPSGGRIELTADETTHSGGRVIRVQITDSGPGIPEKELDMVFDRFHQVRHEEGSDHPIGGTGLGLAICREVVNYHGGAIWAERPSKGGTRVVFVIPIGSKHASMAAGSSQIH